MVAVVVQHQFDDAGAVIEIRSHRLAYLRRAVGVEVLVLPECALLRDRKSTRLNSSHLVISYAVFCLKKKKETCTILKSLRIAAQKLGSDLRPDKSTHGLSTLGARLGNIPCVGHS